MDEIAQYQTAELVGIILESNRNGSITNFRVKCPKINKTFHGYCNFYCPLRDNDTIFALCTIHPDGTLQIQRPPFVQPPIDKPSIIRFFMRYLKHGYDVCSRIFDIISGIAGGDDQVIPFLSSIAQSWKDTFESDILYMFHGVEADDIKKLLNMWHSERNLRRLRLFGLNSDEINACRMSCDAIYRACMTNPYTLPAIPLEKCDAILCTINKVLPLSERINGGIIRTVWEGLHKRGWACFPSGLLCKQYPGIKDYVASLREQYGLITDMSSAYLKRPYDIEVWIANFIATKRKLDVIKYDTPVDKPLIIDGQNIHRHSPIFTRELSEEQQKAVQGALDHKICAVIGSAGTGKCLQKGTPILMYSGDIRLVETIVEGDLVMGPDSRQRQVSATGQWVGDIYKIIPSKGKSFSCNLAHMLTLKGIVPFLNYKEEKVNKYIAKFSQRGLIKSKAFQTEIEAQKYIDSLPEDIFDISLEEYLSRPEKEQRYCYLFHVGIDFPYQPVLFDPYIIGYWLGDSDSSGTKFTIIDSEIVEYHRLNLQQYELQLSHDENVSYDIISYDIISYDIISYDIIAHSNNFVPLSNHFINVLKNYNLINNKHIPDIYKINSRKIRLAVLAGLIDSDEHAYSNGNCIEIAQKNVNIADGIEYLCYSLGFMITRIERTKECMYKGEMRHEQYQIMCISGECLNQIPTILPRNKCHLGTKVKWATCLRFTVGSPRKDTYCGFELSGDGRFLLGNFLVTHNTSILGQLLHNLDLRDIPYAVCSFTGKAVSRIREVTGKKTPATIHRLIASAKQDKTSNKYSIFEKEAPVGKYKTVVIDETSMVTTELLYEFLQAYPGIEQLIFFGDCNQLQPIGWGSLFSELIKSETIPVYKLTQNFRVYTENGERDGIIMNAIAMLNHDPQFDFEFVETDNFRVIEGPIEHTYDIVRGCYNSGIKISQIMVLSPYDGGANGILEKLNKEIQAIYNHADKRITDSRGVTWIMNDRVMLLENIQDIGVFNGESGFICDLNKTSLYVDFGSSGIHEFLIEPAIKQTNGYGTKKYVYKGNIAEEVVDGDETYGEKDRSVLKLTHSYAITIDKSQGSEADFVILPINHFTSGAFINRNRLYTGLTRAKRAVWIVAPNTHHLHLCAAKASPYRADNLGKRLKSLLPNIKPLESRKIVPTTISGDMPDIPNEFFDTGVDMDDFD